MTSPEASPVESWQARHALGVVSVGVLASLVAALMVRSDGISTAELFVLVVPVQSLGIIVTAVLLARRRGGIGGLALRVRWSDLVGVPVGIGIQVVGGAVAWAIAESLFDGEMPAQDVVTAAGESTGVALWVVVVLGLVVIGPLAEEIAFRGILIPALRGRGDRFAVWVSSGWFAALHLLDPRALLAVPILFVVALVMGNELLRTGRLGRPIAIHAGFNLMTVVALMVR